MTPIEKAGQLIVDYQMKCKSLNYDEAKQCALIAVDEIKEFMSPMVHSKQAYDYWDEVKQEINKL